MSNRYVIEALLRPAVELNTAVHCKNVHPS